MKESIAEISFTVFLVLILVSLSSVAALPPHKVYGHNITTPVPIAGTPEKILEINFTINSNNQITLNPISIKNLPPAIVETSNNDYYLEISDSSNNVLFHSNILVTFDPTTNISSQYFAIPYIDGSKFVYIYYKGTVLLKSEIPGENPLQSISFGASLPYVYGTIVIVAMTVFAYLLIRQKRLKEYKSLKEKWS